MKQDIAILIVFFNKAGQTIKCIRSFLPAGVPVYVFNNGSDATQWRRVQDTFALESLVHFLSSEKNLGPAVARNALIKHTREEWMFLVDNDITIQPKDWLELFNTAVCKHSGVNVFLPKLFNVHDNSFAHHPRFVMNEKVVALHDDAPDTNYFPAGAAVVRRCVFDQYGVFDEALFAFEDYEYGIRLLKEGIALEIATLDGITLHHAHIFQQNKKDRLAVKERYHEERLTHSFLHIEQKHQVRFDHQWQWWTERQKEKMAGISIWKKIVRKIKRLTMA